MARKRASRPRAKKPRPCLTQGCPRTARTRGVCMACYVASRTLIKRGETTDEQLVLAKALLPRGVFARRSLFYEQLERSKEAK